MNAFETFLGIMLFYIFLSFLAGPMFFYYFVRRSLKSAGQGYMVGSLLSVILWFFFGSKLV